MNFISWLLNPKIHAKISTKLFFMNFGIKNAKSCHVFFIIIIYIDMIFIFKGLGHVQFKIKLYFLKKDFL
jgi:hypothetical protein